MWEVIETLELYDIPEVSLTSDGAKLNHRFYPLCWENLKAVAYKTINPFREKKDVFSFVILPIF